MEFERITWVDILIVILLALLLAVAITTSQADDAPSLQVPVPTPCPARGLTVDAEVIKIVDGDTIDCRVQFDFRVRLLDCWAPESRTLDLAEKSRGLAAKGYMLELADGQAVRVFVPGSGTLGEILTLDRVLGRVYVLTDGEPSEADLPFQMVEAGHATTTKKEPNE
jgi:endonuclease YncB( thermonuclease family)